MKSLLVLFLTVIIAQATFAVTYTRNQSCFTPGKSLATHFWVSVSDKKIRVIGSPWSMNLNLAGTMPIGNEQVVHVYKQVEDSGAVTVNGRTAKVTVSTFTGQILKIELFYGGVVPSATPFQTLTDCRDSF